MNLIRKTLVITLILISSTIVQAQVILEDLEGNTVSFSSLQGKWVLINYWASWCKTCIDEIPELNHFYQKHQKNSVALFAVNYDALPLYKLKKLAKKLHMSYPSLNTDPAFALGLGDIVGVPATFIINPKGILVDTLYGGQNVTILEAAIEK